MSDASGHGDQPDDPGFGGPSPWEGQSPNRPPLIEPNPFEPGHSQLAATDTPASSNPVQLGEPGEMVEDLPWIAAGPPAATTQTPNTARSVPAVPTGAVETLQPPSPMRPPGTMPLAAEPMTAMPADWSVGLETLIAQAEADVAALPPAGHDEAQREYIEKHVWLRMLYLMAGRPERAIEHIPHINAADQEFWQQVFLGLAGYFDADAVPNPGDRASQTVSQLRAAVQSLQRSARLELRNLAFCQKIHSFGNYERFPQYEFPQGQPLLLYAEVRNFTSEPTAEGQYRTSLKSTVELHNSRGELVQKWDYPPVEDLCRDHRQDFFISYDLVIPARSISVGPHVLKLTLEDQLGRKIASDTLNLTVK